MKFLWSGTRTASEMEKKRGVRPRARLGRGPPLRTGPRASTVTHTPHLRQRGPKLGQNGVPYQVPYSQSFSGVRGDFSERLESLPSRSEAQSGIRHAQGRACFPKVLLPPHKLGVAPSTFPHYFRFEPGAAHLPVPRDDPSVFLKGLSHLCTRWIGRARRQGTKEDTSR